MTEILFVPAISHKAWQLKALEMSNVTFRYSGNDQRLIDAIGYAANILSSDNFRFIIEDRKESFYNTERTCQDIAKTIFECGKEIEIKMFSKRPIFGKLVTAKVKGNVPDTIFFNTYAVRRGLKANTNTIVHETVHVVDRYCDVNSVFDFTHNGNDPNDPPQNRDSAPYWIGNRAEDMVNLMVQNAIKPDGPASLDSLNKQLVARAITQENWAENDGFICEVDD